VGAGRRLQVIRLPFEDVPAERYLSRLAAGDIVFIDNSHRSFQNSDVTVFFLEILPALRPGVIYGLHDIYLPDDYPEVLKDRYYNEQYLLGNYLLAGAGGDRILYPSNYVRYDADRQKVLRPFEEEPYLAPIQRHGCGFWMERGGRASVIGRIMRRVRHAVFAGKWNPALGRRL
jgi:hypothetical protein